jgi:hypothetical protein
LHLPVDGATLKPTETRGGPVWPYASGAVWPRSTREGNRMGAFLYRLEQEDGTSADPPEFRTAVSNWRAGDTIPLGRDKTLRVIEVRSASEPDENPVLVVERA